MPAYSRVLAVVENVVAAAALAAAAGIAIAAVVLRYAFNVLVFWSEEAVIYLVLLSVFVGAVITLRHDEHVRVDLLALVLKGRAQQGVKLLATLLTLVYLGCIGAYGWLLLVEPASRLTVTPALKLPLWVVYFALPLGFTLMFLRTLEVLFRQLTGRVAYPEAAQSVLQAESEGLGLHVDPAQGEDPRAVAAGGSLQTVVAEAVRKEDAGEDFTTAVHDEPDDGPGRPGDDSRPDRDGRDGREGEGGRA